MYFVPMNGKTLVIKKSIAEDFLKSHADRKLEYFKKEILKVLNRQEKEESPEVSKAFIVHELYKSMTDPLYMEKGKVGVVGEIRTWNGKKYKKMPNKKWVRVYDTQDKHAETSIARLKGRVKRAKSIDELFDIVMNNTHRFSDENGKPLDIVLELKKEVDARKKTLNAGKPSMQEQIEKFEAEKKKDENKKLYATRTGVTTEEERKKQLKAASEEDRKLIDGLQTSDERKGILRAYIARAASGDMETKRDKLRTLCKDNVLNDIMDSIGKGYEPVENKKRNNHSDYFFRIKNENGTFSDGGAIDKNIFEFAKFMWQNRDNKTIKNAINGDGGDGGDETPKDGRFEFTQELKQKAVDALNNPTEEINYVDYTRENYNKLFPRGECKTPIGTIKMGDKQFERFADKDNGARIKFMGALQQCLQKPDVIIGKTDNKGRYSKLYLKAFIDNNGKKAYLAVVPNIDNIDIVVSNSPRDTKDIAKEIKKADLCYYIRPALTSSANSGGSRMENSTDGLTSNNSRSEEVKPSDNSKIAHNNAVVNKTVKIDIKDFPEQFNKGKWKKQTKILLDFINERNGDPTVLNLYKRLGEIKNSLPFKIKNPGKSSNANGNFCLKVDARTLEPHEQELQIADITEENEALKKASCMRALHEIMHMIDFSCRKDKKSPTYASAADERLLKTINEDRVSPDEIESLNSFYKDFKGKQKALILSLDKKNDEAKELNKMYRENKISDDDYREKRTKIEEEWGKEEKKLKELRAAEAEHGQYVDVLDSISKGELYSRYGFSGHGETYYKKESNRVAEIVANYGALLASGSEYVEKLKENHPKLCAAVYNIYKQFLER